VAVGRAVGHQLASTAFFTVFKLKSRLAIIFHSVDTVH
jgi:hypothetical protein